MKITKLRRRPLFSGLIIILSAWFIYSCTTKPDLTNHIPKDVVTVMTFDVKGIAVKSLDFGKLFNLDNIKKAIGNIGEKSDSASVSIKDSGLDLTGNAYFFVKSGENKYVAILAGLSDAKEFEAFLKKSVPEATVEETGAFKVASLSNERAVAAWNDNEVLLLFDSGSPKDIALSIFNLKKEESLATGHESYKKLQKEGADISLWINLSEVSKLDHEYSEVTKNINLSETYLTATCNFEEGQIVVDSKYSLNKETAEKYDFTKDGLGNDVVSALPANTLIGLIGVSLDMEKIYNHLEQEKLVEAYGPMANQMTGMPMKDVFNMLSGDLGITLNDITMKEVMTTDYDGNPITRKSPEPNYCAVIGIANKEKATQMLDQFVKTGMLTKADKYYSLQDKVFIIEKGATLVVTGTAATRDAVVAGSTAKLSAEMSSLLTSNATTMYINLPNLPEALYSGSADAAATGAKIKLSEVQDVTMTASSIKENESSAKLVVTFKEKGENTLITMGRLSKEFSKLMEESAVEEPTVVMDTTALP